MRWVTEITVELDTVYKKKFAFLPIPLMDGTTVWWESYWRKIRFEGSVFDETFRDGVPHQPCSYVRGSNWRYKEAAKTKEELISPIDNYYRLNLKSNGSKI